MSAAVPTSLSLSEFNSLDSAAAFKVISHWCAAPDWAAAVNAGRPYKTVAALQSVTTMKWQAANEADLLAAFAAHPMIGDVELLRTKYATVANAEQGQVLEADDATIAQLAKQNLSYSERHGFTFIVFATGKSAAEMLALLNARIDNSRADELNNAATEQLKIMQLRLQQTLTCDA